MAYQDFGLLWRIKDIGGGRVNLADTGISAEFIAGRFVGGESVAELARDYGETPERIEAALRLVLFARGTNLWEKRALKRIDSVIPLLPARRRKFKKVRVRSPRGHGR